MNYLPTQALQAAEIITHYASRNTFYEMILDGMSFLQA
jgi:hypothetical protein